MDGDRSEEKSGDCTPPDGGRFADLLRRKTRKHEGVCLFFFTFAKQFPQGGRLIGLKNVSLQGRGGEIPGPRRRFCFIRHIEIWKISTEKG